MAGGPIRREAVPPPESLDEATLAKLCAAFADIPRIKEAWLQGERTTPDDGSPPWVQRASQSCWIHRSPIRAALAKR